MARGDLVLDVIKCSGESNQDFTRENNLDWKNHNLHKCKSVAFFFVREKDNEIDNYTVNAGCYT